MEWEDMKFGKSQILCIIFLLIFTSTAIIHAQVDSLLSRCSFELDFRFRAEQDWDSRKSDGSFREDRTRLRYRFRTGVTYENGWYKLGFRLRTGAQNKQQDPQLTLGKGLKEFGTLPIGFEKIFFQSTHGDFKLWLGKNAFSFEKNNELFWSDNVFPEGVFVQHNFNLAHLAIDDIVLRASHYVLSSNDGSFFDDAYFQGFQSLIQFRNQRFSIFPSLYLLRNIPDIPDGGHSFLLDYSIFHLGAKLKALSSQKLLVDLDFYYNFEDYSSNDNINDELSDQKFGYSMGVQYGAFKRAKDWKFKLTYTVLQRYAALDYMAQNDWARWDYSEFNSPDGRLTNLQGVELVAGYNITKKINLIAKYYFVSQLVSIGEFKETGQRIRFDLNVKL